MKRLAYKEDARCLKVKNIATLVHEYIPTGGRNVVRPRRGWKGQYPWGREKEKEFLQPVADDGKYLLVQ